ncbi:MAG: dephospho-CoA kinase [Dictyoglomus sp.]|nr:dephospho-CoA kinase [Dictyoglomus sp.]MDW8187703.1 dephospho-CoA kinase [Dictyoglomus sp.]
MFILGITGGISSGKSLVVNTLKSLGVCVISADEIVHSLLLQPYYLNKIREIFGDGVFDGEILNRKKLGKVIFSSEEKRKILNNLLHPPVLKIMKEEIEKNKGKKGILAFEVPLLFEVGIEDWFDEIWVVYCPFEKQIERLIKRENISYEEAIERIYSQMPMEEKIKKAHYIIDNSGSIENTINQVKERFYYIKRMVYNKNG